jgi:hypothetical protein
MIIYYLFYDIYHKIKWYKYDLYYHKIFPENDFRLYLLP